MAGVVPERPHFLFMHGFKIRHWIENNPENINMLDAGGRPVLHEIAFQGMSELLAWSINSKGADVNCRDRNQFTPLHAARSPAAIGALMDRGADPLLCCRYPKTPLVYHAYDGKAECVGRLLEDPRVKATIDFRALQRRYVGRYQFVGLTALHHACIRGPKERQLVWN
jgi:ankyrin repeat protein